MTVQVKRSVGRPREFSEETALIAVMELFWEKGYESTSLTDLCACTGLHKGSLYQAFGDKHQLFMCALRHYADTEFKELAAITYQYDSPLESIRVLFRTIIDRVEEGQGCLLINTLVERGPRDPEVLQIVKTEGDRRIRVLGELLTKAQARGEIRQELEPRLLAQQLMAATAGASTMVKGLISKEQAAAIVENMINSWV